MAQDDRYDDKAFLYFVLAFLSFILIPTTWVYLRKLFTKSKKSEHVDCTCPACKAKNAKLAAKNRFPSLWSIVKFVVYIALLALFIFVLYNTLKEAEQSKDARFDPFEILGLGSDATPEQIKRAFRKLSLQYHPDKNPDDEKAAEMFVKIQKAHAALTDPVVMANMEKYGHPDGPQSFSFGIALPSWLVEGSGKWVVLAVYAAVFMVVIPTVVACWWYKYKLYAPNKVLNTTLGLYYQCLEGTLKAKKMIEVLAASMEYKNNIPLRSRPDALAVERIQKLLPGEWKLPKQPKFNAHFVVKTNALLHAHIARLYHGESRKVLIEESGANIEQDMELAVKLSPPLTNAIIEMVAAKGLLKSTLEAIKVQQMIVQACFEDQPLMQLPHFDEDLVYVCGSKRWRVNGPGNLARLHPDGRKELLEGHGLTDDQLKDVESALKLYPSDIALTITYGVENERAIAPNSIVTVIADVKRVERPPPSREWRSRYSYGRRDYRGSRDSKEIEESENQEAISDEETSTSPITVNKNEKNNGKQQRGGRRGGKQDKNKSAQKEKEKEGEDEEEKQEDEIPDSPSDDAKQQQEDDGAFPSYAKKDSLKDEGEPRNVHAPYYPESKEETWWLILGETTQNKVLNIKQFVLKDRTQVKLQFVAPDKLGNFSYVLHLACDSYIGCDQKKTFVVHVTEDKQEEVMDYGDLSDEEDLEEDEEVDEDDTGKLKDE